MTETTVNRVAELYKEKSELFNTLSKLESVGLLLCGNERGHMGGYFELEGISKLFLAEIKKLTENHIKLRIEEIDNELEKL